LSRIEVRRVSTISGLDLQDRPVLIGRSSDNTLVLSDTRVSRRHCIIQMVQGAVMVRDLGSQRGTFVNGQRVNQAKLISGDRIAIGPFEIVFEDPNAPRNGAGASLTEDVAAQSAKESTERQRIRQELETTRLGLEEQEHTLATRAAELEQRATELDRRDIETTVQHDHQRQADAERLASLQQLLDAELRHRTEDNQRIGGLTQQLESATAHIKELSAALQSQQQRIEQLQQQLAERRIELERVSHQKSLLQQQVEALEAARRLLAERSAAVAHVMAVFRGQVQTLDSAAQKVAALQERLAEIEDAWVQADEELSDEQNDDPAILEAAVHQRQRMSAQLDALNRERDAAVQTMRESAERLLAISQQANLAPPAPVFGQLIHPPAETQKHSIWKRLVSGAKK
jgi:pSer/pThr/pTyr-binding forkhead associated (FHA) protein